MKKIISILLVTVMLMSMTAFVTSAAEASATTGYKEHTITFDASTTDWQNYKSIYCHIWVHGGDPIFAFKSKSEKCVDNGDGTWTYDLDAKGVTLEEGVLYSVLFANENGMQTYNLLLDTSCYGDTAYCDGTVYENPVDSNKTALAAYWSDISPHILGPELCITSIGNVVGTCIPYTTSAFDLFVTFLSPEGNFANARLTSGKTDQEIIDDTARALGLSDLEVDDAIHWSGIYVDWSPKAGKGDVDGDNVVSVMDATAIQRHLALLSNLTGSGMSRADVDGDDTLSVMDATHIQRFLAKLIPSL